VIPCLVAEHAARLPLPAAPAKLLVGVECLAARTEGPPNPKQGMIRSVARETGGLALWMAFVQRYTHQKLSRSIREPVGVLCVLLQAVRAGLLELEPIALLRQFLEDLTASSAPFEAAVRSPTLPRANFTQLISDGALEQGGHPPAPLYG
jgi:hypothetical protein